MNLIQCAIITLLRYSLPCLIQYTDRRYQLDFYLHRVSGFSRCYFFKAIINHFAVYPPWDTTFRRCFRVKREILRWIERYIHIWYCWNRNKIMQKLYCNLPPITSQVSIKVEPSLKASNTPKIRLSVTSLDPSLCTVLETTSPFSLRITEDWGGTTEKLDYERSKLVVIMKQSKSNNW